jgi:ATP-dependent helicase/DNAse subunit B
MSVTGYESSVYGMVVNGAIDRIDQIGTDPETKKPLVKIVDYKTGKVSEKFEKKDKYQLLIYTLAVKDPNILDGEVKELEYYFLDENESRTMEPSEKDAIDTLDWVGETVAKIQQGDFRATPNKFLCDFCDYRDICDFRAI